MEVKSYTNREIKPAIITQLRQAKKSIRIAMAYARNYDDGSGLLDELKIIAKKGLDVQILLGEKDIDTHSSLSDSEIKNLENNNIVVLLTAINQGNYAIMHHKFCVIDGHTVINGSFNWTPNAGEYSAENITIIEKNSVNAAKFLQEFVYLRDNVGGFANTKRSNGGSKQVNPHFDSIKYLIPVISAFRTDNVNPKKGSNINLSWLLGNVDDKTLVEIIENGYHHKISYQITNKTFNIQKNTIFTLKIANELGEFVQKELFIEVYTSNAPQIVRFTTADNTNVILSGQDIVLLWQVENANQVVINGEQVTVVGEKRINITQNTVFELKATNQYNENSQSNLEIRVLTEPNVQLPTFDANAIPKPPTNAVLSTISDFGKFTFPLLPPLPNLAKKVVIDKQTTQEISKSSSLLKSFFSTIFLKNKPIKPDEPTQNID